ncbi:MAG: beta-ketoacyl-ACP synthase II [Gemmatimonadota bacterium]|nr:beta-ketoacyl-ACP synthase II [Gemmatimonadota bacterium]MDH3424377.1 beta-ketoacyl-ACP synthase II [Gemmatimonadota bacterium]
MENGSGGVRRVVVTGMGLVSPVGNDVASSWDSLLAGRSGGGTVTAWDITEDFPCRIGCEVKGFDPTDHMDKRDAKRFDRVAQLAIAASGQALASAGLETLPAGLAPERFGVVFGSGIGGIATFEEQHRKLIESGPNRVSPFFVPMFIPDISAGLISMRWGLRGPNYATVSACASSAHAIGNAMRHIRYGDADLMLAGGSEATITPMTYAGFSSMKAMSTRNDDPSGASRPFSADRDGFVMGEGAGAVILEALEHAEARGAEILAEVVGYGLSGDAHHITAPPPDGYGAQHAMRMALSHAGADVGEVDYVNAHGTSTMADAIETAAIKAVLGPRAKEIVVGSTKSMTGHLLGAAGALEAIACIQVCRTGKIPPTINFQGPDPDCDLEYAHGGMIERPVELALTNSFGFGGHNVCLALRRWD